MHQVNIAELKNRLSYYLDKVRGGEELIVRDRQKPIARIVPLTNLEDEDSELLELVAAGIIKLPEGELPDSFWKMPRPRVDQATALAAILADRDED
jgi:prevent-host-death family protein